jgi:hypothetical protein
MIYGGGFVCEGGVGTKMHDPFSEMQDQWTHLLDEANINGERLFVTQPTHQSTVICVDADEAPTGPDLTWVDDAKKKGRATGPAASTTTGTYVCAMCGSQSLMTE